MSRRPLSAVFFGIALAVAPVWLIADDFSLERLRAGEGALRANRIPEAVDQLRIACFGLLDQAEALSECLVHLTLAQNAAKRPADVEATLVRFLDVESRFAPYAKAVISPESRREFQAILLSRVPQATILSIPSLASLVETEEQRIAKLTPAERVKALEAAEQREPAAMKWPVALVQTRVALKQYRRALDEMAKLPAEVWTSRPELYADVFVCQVETKDWSGADGSRPKIPPVLMKRADVEKAVRDLAAERVRRSPR